MSGKRQPQNPAIGRWRCPLGGDAVVRQASKRGRHFYTQCECCGVQMGTAAARQTKIWREAEFSPPDGVNVYKPGNVSDEGGELPAKSEPVEAKPEAARTEQPEAVDRWRPGDMEAAAGETETETEAPAPRNRGALVAGVVGLLALVGGAWLS